MDPTTIVLIVLTVLVTGLLSAITAGVYLVAANTLATCREITAVYAQYEQDREKSTKAFIDAMVAMPLPCDKQPEEAAQLMPLPPGLDVYLDAGMTAPPAKRKRARKETKKKPRKRSPKK